MRNSITITLPDDLLDFINQNIGPDTPYRSANEFVVAALQDQRDRLEAAEIRETIIAGYQDAIAGRWHTYDGDLRKLMKKVKP